MSFFTHIISVFRILTPLTLASHIPVLISCDGIGRPLVGEFEDTERQCAEAPECGERLFSLSAISVSPADVQPNASNCDYQSQQSCRSITSDSDVVTDRGTGCELSLDPTELSETVQTSSRFECAKINLENETSDWNDSSPLRLQHLDLTHSVFEISSQTPIVVELEAPSLSHVTFSIHGDVTLRINRTAKFDHIRVYSESEIGNRPTLELMEVTGQRLFIGGESEAFNGTVEAVRSELDDSGIFADGVRLESVRISRTTVDSTSLTGADASFYQAMIAFDEAVLSASRLFQVDIPRCESLTTISSTIEACRISACTASSFRAYSTDVIDASLDGSIEIDQGIWDRVRFGNRQATFVVGWDFELNAATFCRDSRSFRIGGNTSISCSRCETEFFREADSVCLLPDAAPIIGEHTCAVFFQSGDCPEPIPPRTRP